MEDKIDFKTINDKINNISTRNKVFAIGLMLAILGTLYFVSTVDTIETITYLERGVVVCEETYINAVINGSYCMQNTLIYPKKQEEYEWLLPEIS